MRFFLLTNRREVLWVAGKWKVALYTCVEADIKLHACMDILYVSNDSVIQRYIDFSVVALTFSSLMYFIFEE